MFVIAVDHKKGVAATPIIWTKKISTQTGYYWPLYGLHFKLKNYVPLPIDSQELRKEWRWVPCTILLNGKQFKTLADAENAVSILLKEENESKVVEPVEGESSKKVTDGVEVVDVESAAAESFEKEVDEVNSDVVDETDTEISREVVLDDVEPVVADSFEKEVDEVNSNVVDETDTEESVEVVLVDVEPVFAESFEKEVHEVNSGVVDEAEESVDVASSEKKSVEEESDEDDENFENFPLVKVEHFMENEVLLKSKNRYKQLNEFYIKINENAERKFVDECVRLSFDDDFFLQKITFKKDKKKRKNGVDCLGVFHETRRYKCLKEALVIKLNLSDSDETALKNIFITHFDRIKRAIRART